MKYVVFKGKHYTTGSAVCQYEIYDIMEIDHNLEPYEELRKYSFRKFFEMGAKAKSMRDDVFHYKKTMTFGDGRTFIQGADVFHHTHSFLIFIPLTNFII